MKIFRARRGRPQESGLTLLELMVTLAIVAIGILGLTSMNFQSARAVQDAAEISLGSNLATATIDELQVGDYDTYSTGALAEFPIYFDKLGRSLPDDTGRYFEVNASIVDESPLFGYKDVEVRVSWRDNRLGGAQTNTGGNREVIVRGRLRQLAPGG
ncbi:MAG: prepilin-type N-terminal cleavage/methylation domain-containing protein [Myxococcota bacterium]